MLLYFVKPLLQITPKFFLHFFGQLLYIRFAVFQQMFYVHLTRIRMLAYNFIQMWLSKFRVIAFIVTMTTITDHINKNIGIKFLAITCRHFYTFYNGLRIVAIHMQHWCLNSGCQ